MNKHKDIYRLKVNEWRKIYHANSNQKKAGIAIFTSEKDFKTRKGIRDKKSIT